MRSIDADALMKELEREVELADDWKTAHEISNVVKYFPTIEPEKRTGKRTKTHACDCISRQAAISVIAKWMLEYGGEGEERERNALKQAAEEIRRLPSVEPDLSEYSDKLWKAAYERGKAEALAERKTGKWIPQDHNRRNGYVTTTVYYYPKCSECGRSGNYGMNYCPNCGAYMKGEQDETD